VARVDIPTLGGGANIGNLNAASAISRRRGGLNRDPTLVYQHGAPIMAPTRPTKDNHTATGRGSDEGVNEIATRCTPHVPTPSTSILELLATTPAPQAFSVTLQPRNSSLTFKRRTSRRTSQSPRPTPQAPKPPSPKT